MPRIPGRPRKIHPLLQPLIVFKHKRRIFRIALTKKISEHQKISNENISSIDRWLGDLRLLRTELADGRISGKTYKIERKRILNSLERFLDEL